MHPCMFQIILYCDLHGHSRKHNVFMYGCNTAARGSLTDTQPDLTSEDYIMERLFPWLMSQKVFHTASWSDYFPGLCHKRYSIQPHGVIISLAYVTNGIPYSLMERLFPWLMSQMVFHTASWSDYFPGLCHNRYSIIMHENYHVTIISIT